MLTTTTTTTTVIVIMSEAAAITTTTKRMQWSNVCDHLKSRCDDRCRHRPLTLDLEAVNNEREENFEASYEFSGKTLVVDGFRINETGITAAPGNLLPRRRPSLQEKGAASAARKEASGAWTSSYVATTASRLTEGIMKSSGGGRAQRLKAGWVQFHGYSDEQHQHQHQLAATNHQVAPRQQHQHQQHHQPPPPQFASIKKDDLGYSRSSAAARARACTRRCTCPS